MSRRVRHNPIDLKWLLPTRWPILCFRVSAYAPDTCWSGRRSTPYTRRVDCLIFGAASTYTADDVTNAEGFRNYENTLFSGADFIWSSNLELDNQVVCLATVSAP